MNHESNFQPEYKSEERVKELESKVTQLEHKIQTLEDLAYRDNTTGLLNRNGLKKELEDMNLGRGDKPRPKKGSMLVIDIDNFKIINDTFGHSVGDEVLMAVSQHLNERTRSTDLAARWGGEEFVIIFDKTDEEGILRKLYERREDEEVGRPRFNVQTKIEGKLVNITLSGGVTDFKLGENLDDVFRRADQALYRAKAEGKDRVVGAREEE